MDLSPIWLTLKLAGITTLLLLLVGLPFAWWLSRGQSFYKIIIEAIITMPLVLPPSVLGFYLLLAFSPQHGLGKWLQGAFDVQFVFSFKGLVLASVIYSMPFMVGPVKSALQQLPASLSEASYTLGKTQWQTFKSVLLPNIKPSLLTAIVLTFAHTLGEFGVVLMIGGNIPGVTRVASIAVYDSVEKMDYASANNYSLILFSITFVLVIAVFVYNKYQAKKPFRMISIAIEKKLSAYEGQQVLRIDKKFVTGSITKIYGPSGSGKTTFLKIIAGLISPEKGKIIFNDKTWFDDNSGVNLSPQNRKVGFVFQNYALFPNMTVRQHLDYATTDEAWIKRLLLLGKLDTLAGHKPDHLSGGQQQRLAILRALAIKPKILLMDEPFSALDSKMKAVMIEELKVLFFELGITVLIVSHNLQELDAMDGEVMNFE